MNPKAGGEPCDGLIDVGVGEYGDDGGFGDGAVWLHRVSCG